MPLTISFVILPAMKTIIVAHTGGGEKGLELLQVPIPGELSPFDLSSRPLNSSIFVTSFLFEQDFKLSLYKHSLYKHSPIPKAFIEKKQQ